LFRVSVVALPSIWLAISSSPERIFEGRFS